MTDPVFFAPARQVTVGEIAALTGAEIAEGGDAAVEVSGLAPLDAPAEGSLVFVTRGRNLSGKAVERAAAILCPREAAGAVPKGPVILLTANPQRDFAAVGRLLYPAALRPAPMTGETGVSAAAHVDATARIEAGAIVEAGAFVAPGAEIGRGTIVAPQAVVGPGCRVGRDGYVGPGVVLQCALIGDRVILHAGAKIGQDGFGYVPGKAGADKIPQIGRVIIQNDVEIGANTTIDRGALGDTVIGEGTKIDNQVQVGHNVRIGRVCLIAGKSGISGSVTIGDFVMMGGQVGIADHVTIGSFVQLAAMAGVAGDIPPNGIWAGAPAKPIREAAREQLILRNLVQKETDEKHRR